MSWAIVPLLTLLVLPQSPAARGAVADLELGRRLLGEMELEAAREAFESAAHESAAIYLADLTGPPEARAAALLAHVDRLEELDDDTALFLLRRLGEYASTYDPAAARAWFDRRLARAERLDRPGALALAKALSASVAAPDAADALYEEALELVEAEGTRPEEWAEVTFRAARHFRDRQRLDAAGRLHAAALARELSSTRWRIEFTNLARELDLLRGQYSRAAEKCEQLRKMLRDKEPGTWRQSLLTDTADALYRLGRYDECDAVLEELIGGARSTNDAELTVKALMTTGFLQEEAEDFGAAIETYTAAFEDHAARLHPWYHGALLCNRARAHRLNGDLDAATEDLLRTLGESGNPDVVLDAAARDGLAWVHLERGELDAALDHALAAVETFRSAQPEPMVDYLLDSTLLGLARVHVARGELEEARAVLSEAEGYLESTDVQTLGAPAVANLRTRYTRWGELAQDLMHAQLEVADRADRAELTRLGWEWADAWKGRALLAGVRRHSPGGTPETLEVLSATLDRGALVEFACGADTLFAYTLCRGVVDRVVVGDRETLEAAAWELFEGLFVTLELRSAADVARAGSELHDALLAPVVAVLPPETGELVIVPTAELAALPFEALVVEAPASPLTALDDVTFVLDRYEVSYAPSRAVLAALTRRDRRTEAAPALFLADAVFPSEAADVARRSSSLDFVGPLSRLRWTKSEALDAAWRLVPPGNRTDPALATAYTRHATGGARSDAWSTPYFDVYYGAQATPAVFRTDLSRYGIIHCATHGHVDRDLPERTGLVFSPDDSGDALLSLGEIRELRLAADLVVLSACQTARGRVLRGEGVLSMASAFLSSGARGVVATLAYVRDLEAHSLMSSFYPELGEGRAAATALRRAKSRQRRAADTRGIPLGRSPAGELPAGHPITWAPFVYIGALR